MIVDVYNMYINIKNQVHSHSEDLIKVEKIETKNILIDEKILRN